MGYIIAGCCLYVLIFVPVFRKNRKQLKQNLFGYLQSEIYFAEDEIQKIGFKSRKNEWGSIEYIVTAMVILRNEEGEEQNVIETSIIEDRDLAVYLREVRNQKRIKKMENRNVKRMR
ncbi:hypothetical protein HB904_17775 [Listeria booriae]|uniref:Uncharacterized protein n=2 Tax=Listeria booriae TaxID=1552123 RepID=A0A842AND1_9LIST|nr:hypothetical protein [Listeria booriae]